MPPDSNVESTLIWYKASDKGNIQHWQHQLDAFLASEFSILYFFLQLVFYRQIFSLAYEKENNPNYNNVEQCLPHQKPSKGKVCDVKLDAEWQKCVKENGYNYDSPEGGPCIFLKLNKVCRINHGIDKLLGIRPPNTINSPKIQNNMFLSILI